VRTDQHEYLGNLLASLHGSVLEHASDTFAFHNVSRVFTHELVRHRAGSAFSQESLRYVRLAEIGFRVPEALLRSCCPRRARVVPGLQAR
jgi:thymidylate synthase (FAD)